LSTSDKTTTERLPVTIIGGYLGAGKTALVNHLLRQADGLRLAVLVNEFGTLPIDADLIESQDGNVISIAGGCVCCSYGNDLVMAMLDLARMTPRPEHVLLEASGVALPGAIAASIDLLADYAVDGVLVLADAETIRARAADRYMGDTIERQLAAADIIILNKADLVPADTADTTVKWLAGMAAGARVLTASHAKLPAETILHSSLGRTQSDHAATAHQPDLFETMSITLDGAMDAEGLARRLADPRLGLVRAKGFVTAADGTCVAIQVVGNRWTALPAPAGVRGGGIVCIGPKPEFDHAQIEQAIEHSRV
jgi:G3E family GTPase